MTTLVNPFDMEASRPIPCGSCYPRRSVLDGLINPDEVPAGPSADPDDHSEACPNRAALVRLRAIKAEIEDAGIPTVLVCHGIAGYRNPHCELQLAFATGEDAETWTGFRIWRNGPVETLNYFETGGPAKQVVDIDTWSVADVVELVRRMLVEGMWA